MPAGFSRAQVEAVAALAHLELEAEEVELLTRQLGDILEYAAQVQRIDTTGVTPTSTVVERPDVERDDDVAPSLAIDDALANAPDADRAAGFFKVPRVIG